MGGEDLIGGSISRVRSFIADGSGNITGALEDVNDVGSAVQTVSFSGGSYTVDASGHGTMQLLQGSTVALQFNIVLSSTSQGLLIQTDLNATSSGNFTLASATAPAAFILSQISGPYVFDDSGVQYLTTCDVVLSILCQLTSNMTNESGVVFAS